MKRHVLNFQIQWNAYFDWPRPGSTFLISFKLDLTTEASKISGAQVT